MDKASGLMLAMVAVAAFGGVALGWALRAIADKGQRREHRRLVTAIVQQGLRAVVTRSSAPPEPDTAVTTFIRPVVRNEADRRRVQSCADRAELTPQGEAWHAFVRNVDGEVGTRERAETELFSQDDLQQMLEEPDLTKGAAARVETRGRAS